VRRASRRALFAIVLAVAGGCAKAPPARIPAGEDYVYPAADRRELRPEEVRAMDEAWRDVLAGDGASAEKAFTRLLARRPGLVPAQSGLGYARLRAGRSEAAAAAFDSALRTRPDHLPSLIGAAAAARRLGDPEKALGFLRRAQAAAWCVAASPRPSSRSPNGA
jgi:predicted Zn-dependent protease